MALDRFNLMIPSFDFSMRKAEEAGGYVKMTKIIDGDNPAEPLQLSDGSVTTENIIGLLFDLKDGTSLLCVGQEQGTDDRLSCSFRLAETSDFVLANLEDILEACFAFQKTQRPKVIH